MFIFRLEFCCAVDQTPSPQHAQTEKGVENMEIVSSDSSKDEVILLTFYLFNRNQETEIKPLSCHDSYTVLHSMCVVQLEKVIALKYV